MKKKAEPQFDEAEIDKIVQEELKKQEKRRKLLVVCCSVIAVVCLGYSEFITGITSVLPIITSN